MTRERCAERDADGGDLVFGLHGPDPEVLVFREFVEDVARRGDRIRAEGYRQLGELSRRDEPPREGHVPGDARVLARREAGGPHLVAVPDRLGRLAEVVAGGERGAVGRLHEFVLGEFRRDPLECRLDRPRVHPRHQAEGEEVLRSFGISRLDAEIRAHLLGQRRHRHTEYAVAGEGSVVERILLVARLGEVAFLECVLVDDDRAAGLEAVQVGHHRRRVHHDEHVRLVARGGDVVVGDVDLEGRDAVDRPGRGPDLGGEVGHRRQVVAERGANGGESITGQLHSVAGVTSESDDEMIEDSIVVGRARPFDRVGHVVCFLERQSPRHRCRGSCPSR